MTIFDGTYGVSQGSDLAVFHQIDQLECGGDPNPKFSTEQRARSAIRDKMAITLNATMSGLNFAQVVSNSCL
jgi:hypothetical protein